MPNFLDEQPDAFEQAFANNDPLDLPPPTDDEPGVIWEIAPGRDSMKDQIVAALKMVYDPEIPESVYDLGLIYRIIVEEDGSVEMDFTLTSPNCPEAEELPGAMERALLSIGDVPNDGLTMRLVWNPPWGPERLTLSARLSMGLL